MMNNILRIFFICLFLHSSLLQAAKIQVIGSGQAVGKPDQVQFSISIQSKCYSTLQEAVASTDKVTQSLFQQLNKIFPKKDNNNQITTQGGYTQRYEFPQYRENARVCENTYQKVTTINIVTTEVESFESLFGQVQNVVYQLPAAQPDNLISKAVTFVTMSEPVASLSLASSQQLEMIALDQALKNAIAKAKKLVADQGGSALKIVDIAESLPTPPPMRPMMRAMAMEASTAPPIAFENNVVEKSLSVIFEF